MADDLSDFQPVAAATPAHDVSDFEPVSSPATARSPASTSDLSDFEPAESNKVVDPKKAATIFSGMPVEAGPHKFTGENQYGALFTPPEITPKDIERVSPILSAVNPLFGVTHGLLPRTTSVATSGAANVVSGFANMLNSDEGLLMLGTGGLPKAAQSAVGLAFAAHAIKDSPEAVNEFVSAKTDEDRSKALTRILNNFAIGGGGILHGFGRPVLKTPGDETPPAPTGKHAEIVNTARNEMRRAADETSKEVEPVLSKLPGDTQDRVRGIIAKQASGIDLSPDERATLIQVQSFASRTVQGQTAEQFTAPTGSPPTSLSAAGAAAGTPSDIPGGSPPSKGNLFAQAKQEAAAKAVAPLVESAQAAQNDTPAAAEAARQAVAVIAEKTSSPTAEVEPPTTTGQAGAPTEAAEGRPSEAVLEPLGGPSATGAAGVKPETKPAGTKIAGPAIIDDTGKVISRGEVGSSHADLKAGEIEKGNTTAADARHVFLDDQGNVLDREQAWELAKKSGQINPETLAAQQRGEVAPELHSENLVNAEPVEPAAPAPKTDTRKFKPETIPDVLKELEEEKPAAPAEPAKTEGPTPSPIDKDAAATATRGIPGALGDAVRDVLLNDKSVEEAAAANGTTVKKVQDSVDRMRQYLSDKAAKAAEESKEEATPETPAEPTVPKEPWQRTRGEVATAGDSLAAHRLAVRKAVGEGHAVPLEVLEDFKGSPWADKAREKLYSQQISDTLLGKILKGLTDEGNTLYSDPLFINSVGKPVLRAAVKILQEGIEGGKLAGDAITDALGYLREHIPNLNEGKANEFFDQFFEKPDETTPQPQPESSSVETPGESREQLPPGEEAPPAPRTEGDTTSIKRAVVDEQARQQGREEIPTEIRPKDEVIVAQAKARIDSDPSLAKRMVGEILDDGKTGVTEQDAAVLLAERRRMRNERKSWEAVAGDENSSPAQKASAHAELERIEQEQYRLDKASRSAMREWSDVGRMAQREILEDYSLDSLKSKERAARGRALTKEEIDVISKQAGRIQELEKTAEKTEAAAQEGSAFEEMARIYESTIDSIEREQKLAPKVSEPVLDVARKIVERWKAEADVARADMKNLFGTEGGGVGGVGGGKGAGRKLGQGGIEQSRIETIAKIMRAHVGEIGLKSAEIFDRVLTEFGDKVKSYLEPAWKKMKELVDSEKSPREVRDAVKKGIKTKKKTPVDFKARAKAEAIAGEKLSHQTVFELAKAHANEGIRGEDNLMKVVHEDIKEAYPDATERDVRRAFVDYGKKTYPSREEVAVHLAEARQLVKIQEDITREMERSEGKIDPETGELIGAEKQGFQRPKNTQKVRELIKQRNALLKKRQGPPNPEKLVSADQARQTALENRIADIDKELRTGEKPPEPGEPTPLSSRTETLMAERDAMAEKLREVRESEKPKSSPEEIAAGKAQEAVDRAAVALDRQQRINSGEIKPEPTEKVQPLSDLEKELKDQTEALRKAKRAAEAKTPEEIAANKAQLGVNAAAASLDRWDRILKGEISPEGTPFTEPLSNLEEEIKSQVEAMKQAHREIKAAARPKTDLEARQQEIQMKALEKSIAEYERMAREVDLGGHGRRHGPDVEAISKMKDVRDAAKKVVKEMRDARKIIKSPEQIYNEAQTKRIALRLKEAREVIAKGDFSKPPKRIPPKLNEENVKAKAELQALKDKIDTKRAQVEWENRPAFERRYDQLTGVNRFGKLSRIKTLAKLLAMSVQKLGTTPIHELTSGVLSKTPGYRNLSRLADTEGGFSGDALKKFYGGFFKKGFDDARQAGSPILNIITRGKYGDISARNPLKTLYGHREGLEKRWYDIPQIIHEMEKSPLLRASFEMNSEKLFKHAAAEGMDITKPEVQGELLETAYRAAERDILMNPNAFAAMVNRGIRMLEEPNKVTGKVTLRGKAGAFAARAMVTFIRVATNHFVQTFNATTGLISGHVRYAHALAKGMENLHPEDANSIMRQLKHGVPGAAMVTLGLVAPQLFGGLDPQRKRKASDPAFGEMKVGGVTIPRWVVFAAPWLLAGQIAATAMHTSKSFRRKHDVEPRGALEGLGAATAALAETGPLVNEGAQAGKLLDNNQRGKYFSDLLESNLVPGLLTEAAEWGDKTPDGEQIKRDPKSFVDHIKMHIPVLRKQVPRKVKKLSYR